MKFVLLGEPATGKSSMLVALYGALVHRHAGDMRIVRTVDDVEFLSRGLEAFGRREPLRRTEVDAQTRLMIEVAHGGNTVSIEIPDRSGELLKHMIDARVWEPQMQQQVREADGTLLFLRADELLAQNDANREANRPPALVEQDTQLEPVHLYGDAVASAQPHGENSGEPPPWSPALMPLDVRAVDLLQALLEERSRPLPLAVIISAWDRAAAVAAAPGFWLAECVPLLSQFLANHSEQLPHAVFGVSAQGGEFDGSEPLREDADDPWERAYLIGPDGVRGTFAEPITWLVNAAS